MGQVSVSVNGKSYTLSCEDGEEDHLVHLAGYIDRHVQSLSDSVGAVGDSRLLLMAGLLVADELSEALGRLKQAETELSKLSKSRIEIAERADENEKDVANALTKAAQRIEAIAGQLKMH